MTTHAPNHNPKTTPDTLWVGIDVSKTELQLHSPDPSVRLPVKLSNDIAGFKSLIKRLAPHGQVHVVFEATGGYDKPLLDALQAGGIACSRLNPRQVRNFARAKGLLAKTDAIDASILADYGATFRPTATLPVDPQLEEITALVNYRRHLIDELGREEMQNEHAKPKTITALIKSRIRTLKSQIGKVEKLMAAAIRSSPFLRRAVAALVEVKGVGQLTAVSLLASMPELGTLNRNQAAALAGLAPFNCDSGTLRGKRTIYGGRHAARQAIYMSALTAAKHNEILSEAYRKMVERGKAKKVALVAIMRRLLIHLNSIMSKVLQQEKQHENLTS
jgi:transposase